MENAKRASISPQFVSIALQMIVKDGTDWAKKTNRI
jgi:hypothetical protein